MTTRPQQEIQAELQETSLFAYARRLRLGIELYISKLSVEQQPAARQQLPYLVQFGPILLTYGRHLPDMRWVNPGIAYGGLTEYDKTAIYARIPSDFQLHTKDIARPADYSYEAVLEMLDDLKFPLMVKAQTGERGVGIYYMHDAHALQQHWHYRQKDKFREPLSFQEYATLPQEYCLQFYQTQTDDGIKIQFGGLTWRDTPQVIGNGEDRIEVLIQQLDCSSSQQTKIIRFLHQVRPDLLDYIPIYDEKVQVVFVASIDYGTVYRTITLTTHQIQQIERVLQQLLVEIPPSYLSVGRFDLKAASLKDVLEGKVKVIECNAGGGIPTHVYDEHLSIMEKYTILDKHFGRMMEIAQKNKQQYAGPERNIGAWIDILRASYASLAKKNIDLFSLGSEKGKSVRKLYSDIFALLRKQRLLQIKETVQDILNLSSQ